MDTNRQDQTFFLYQKDLFIDVEETKIELGYRSDHSSVTLSLKRQWVSKGDTFWKFNNSLLKDQEYVNTVKKVIENVKTQYVENTASEINNSDIKFSINYQLFLEVLLMEIRGKTISYASFKKKQTDKTENKLIQEINNLEQENSNNTLLEEKREALKDLRTRKLEGLKIRSRAKWIDQGEKVTKYFCNLENRNYVSKNMPNIWKNDGSKTTNQKEIVEEVGSFYETLYEYKNVDNIDLNQVLYHSDIPKLEKCEADKLEGMITKEEALNCLKNMKNNKSPGSDGFTIEFFKFFWRDLGDFLVKAINNSFELGELSVTQKERVYCKSGNIQSFFLL